MGLPYEELDEALNCFIQTILDDPSSKSAQEDIRSVVDLANSLGGLPPMTFRIFALMNEKSELGPHLLMHAGEKEMVSIVALADGLLFDWATVPKGRLALVRRSKRSRDDDFHDRFIEVDIRHAGGAIKRHELTIGRGVEALYNNRRQCTVTYAPPGTT